jgi:hypothetical protein
VAGGEEGLAKVAGDDVFGVANGGQVDAGVPPHEYIDVRRYMLQLNRGQDNRFLAGARRLDTPRLGSGLAWRAQEGFQQLSDAGRVHGESRL